MRKRPDAFTAQVSCASLLRENRSEVIRAYVAGGEAAVGAEVMDAVDRALR